MIGMTIVHRIGQNNIGLKVANNFNQFTLMPFIVLKETVFEA